MGGVSGVGGEGGEGGVTPAIFLFGLLCSYLPFFSDQETSPASASASAPLTAAGSANLIGKRGRVMVGGLFTVCTVACVLRAAVTPQRTSANANAVQQRIRVRG